MRVDEFVSRLDGVRVRGDGRYLAKCPSHQDRSPSLSVAEKDGKILVKCFAGCPVDAVVAAVGLTLSDLMPDNPDYSRGYAVARSHGYKHEWFEKLLYESSILALFVEGAGDGFAAFSSQDIERVVQAIATIDEIRRAYAGR